MVNYLFIVCLGLAYGLKHGVDLLYQSFNWVKGGSPLIGYQLTVCLGAMEHFPAHGARIGVFRESPGSDIIQSGMLKKLKVMQQWQEVLNTCTLIVSKMLLLKKF